jgi:anti-sigma B factor antagonist
MNEVSMNNISVSASTHPLHKDITLVSAKGFIDTTTAPEFERTFQSVLSQNKFNLIIDLKDVSYISSAGWGIFIGELKRIRSQKGNLFFASMNPEVSETFELLELHSILKSYPSVEHAVQKGFERTSGNASALARKGSPKKSAASPAQKMPETDPSPLAVLAEETQTSVKPSRTPWFDQFFKMLKWF